MQPRESGVQYSRWQDSGLEEVGMAVASGTIQSSRWDGISGRLCKLGTTMKVLSALALLCAVFILGYTTGYYVHKCK
ncbi:small integral membrane protein 1 [Talpa occidentalis]|uniref:small integral membrane protein 1 n=1 Tax=Talpa occidentalis TaxID=50954 RepID=UPI0018908F9C|nr:small integral membrane protein 1 [Talpa occidentalis]